MNLHATAPPGQTIAAPHANMTLINADRSPATNKLSTGGFA